MYLLSFDLLSENVDRSKDDDYERLYTQANILDLVKKFIPENPIILEAGAFLGNDTKKLCSLWPKGFIYAFEPFLSNFNKVKQSVQGFKNVKLYNCALSDFIGSSSFFVNQQNPGASSLFTPITFSYNYQKEPITVNCVTLDYWATQNNVDHIDFIWLDVEGAELNVLKAGENILRTVKVIHVEVNFKEFWKDIALFKELRQWLEEKKFRIVWRNTPSENHQANVLFVAQ